VGQYQQTVVIPQHHVINVHAHAAAHPDCIVLRGPDSGISDAMNKGIAVATGDAITFLHADDFYPRDDILQQVAVHFQRQPDLEWLTGGLSHFDSTNSAIRTFSVLTLVLPATAAGQHHFHPAYLYQTRGPAAGGRLRHWPALYHGL